jgi:hypothetical protein
VVNIPSGGTGIIGIAAVNIGAGEPPPACPQGGCTCTTFMAVSSPVPSVTVEVCETNPRTGACLSPPVKVGGGLLGLNKGFAANEIATLTIFVRSSAAVEFDPVVNRIAVRFADFRNCFIAFVYGATSVAIRSQP